MDLEQKAIERIKLASEMSLRYYGKPLVCTYSGGKDSDVMLELFKRSKIPFEVSNSHTTVDAPQTVHHVKRVFQDLEMQGIKCSIDYHRQADGSGITMWKLIERKLFPPTRLLRYCCSVLKESSCKNRMIATGVRWGESAKRRNTREVFESISPKIENKIKISDEKMLLTDNDDTRKLFEQCQLKAKTVVNPIIDWTTRDVWEFIDQEHLYVNLLYRCGYNRVGCIGCPIKGKQRWKDFANFPKYKDAYIRTFDRMLDARKARGKESKWKTGYEVFLWWMEDKNIPGQMSIDDWVSTKKQEEERNEINT